MGSREQMRVSERKRVMNGKLPYVAEVRGLRVYQLAFESSMLIFDVTRCFPRNEQYSLTDQILRASRSVCANLAEAWSKRKYPAHFIMKLSDAECEARETQIWIDFCRSCRYLQPDFADTLRASYDEVIRMLVSMRTNPNKWVIKT